MVVTSETATSGSAEAPSTVVAGAPLALVYRFFENSHMRGIPKSRAEAYTFVRWLVQQNGFDVAAPQRLSEVVFSDDDLAELARISRSRTAPASWAQRARMLLAYRENPSFYRHRSSDRSGSR
jgi:hypothetical protein